MISSLILLLSITVTVSSESLLDRLTYYRYYGPMSSHRHNGILDYSHQLQDDSFQPLRSIYQVASFRGKPILSRQNHVFIDDNGIPVPIPKPAWTKLSPK